MPALDKGDCLILGRSSSKAFSYTSFPMWEALLLLLLQLQHWDVCKSKAKTKCQGAKKCNLEKCLFAKGSIWAKRQQTALFSRELPPKEEQNQTCLHCEERLLDLRDSCFRNTRERSRPCCPSPKLLVLVSFLPTTNPVNYESKRSSSGYFPPHKRPFHLRFGNARLTKESQT